ncbi:MAG: HlyD family efflux transporter periplasmic adaptor subunit [Aureliella sp.]
MLASLVAGTVLSTATAAPTQPSAIANTNAVVTSWRRLEQCPVLVEDSVEVPALESGVIVELAVELNQAISPDELIAKLDQEQAAMGVEMAKLKHQSALSLAEDSSEIDYQQLALQEIQNELTSYEKISKSVSSSEIRRLNLQVGKARLALVRARQASARAKVEAGVLATEIELAENRLSRRSVVSPLGGIVASVDKQVGQWVEAGETIAKIENLSELGVDAIVPVDSIDRGNIVGTPVRVVVSTKSTKTNGTGDVRLPGQVVSFDHKVSARGLIRLHCRVRNTTHRGSFLLLPGANVDLEIANTESNATASNRQRVSPQSVSR